MVKKKHASFTLLEVMIALALLGVLLSFLFSYFRHTLTTKNTTLALKEKVLNTELFQLRIGNLFEKFSLKDQSFLANIPHSDAMGSALIFFCDHGIDKDPSFSGPIHSMLFKTRDQRLCLCSWSCTHVPKVDTLLKGVKELSFEFFSGKQWQTLWPKDKKESAFPLMIKISILLQGDEEKKQDFIFSLPPNEIYQNNLKNRNFDKEASQNFDLERMTIVLHQGMSEGQNFEIEPTLSKADSSSCFGIKAIT